jgi:hypothetical protein
MMLCAMVAVTLAAVSHDAEAQRRGRRRGLAGVVDPPELGVRAGYDFHVDHFSLGGQVRVPARVLELLLSADTYIQPGTNPYQLNADLVLRLGPLRSLYAGGGVGYLHNAASDVGPNIVVGIDPRRRGRSHIRPYAEGRWTVLDAATPFRFVFGVNLVLGR